MAGDDMEQHGEVRQRRGAAAWVAVVAVVVLVGSIVWAGPGDAPSEATPPTSATTVPTTRIGPLPVLHVVADTDAGARPATTAAAPDPEAGGIPFEALQAAPIVTDGQVVLLVDGGAVLVGRPGGAFAAIDLGVPSSALVASNEPGHVWVRLPRDELALVDVDGADPSVRIPLDGDRVLGPATFGVVTVSEAGVASWRRPSFDPTALELRPDEVPVDAGGGAVLLQGLVPPGGGRSWTIRSVVDGTVIQTLRSARTDGPAAIAADGSTVALPHAAGWIVHDVASGEQRGSLPAAPGDPVWVGDGRFAALTDGVVSLSDGTTLSPPWRLRALAEQSP